MDHGSFGSIEKSECTLQEVLTAERFFGIHGESERSAHVGISDSRLALCNRRPQSTTKPQNQYLVIQARQHEPYLIYD